MFVTANDSSKLPAVIERDGAHESSQPCVPEAYAVSGRVPAPPHGAFGTSTVPETAIAPPCALVER